MKRLFILCLALILVLGFSAEGGLAATVTVHLLQEDGSYETESWFQSKGLPYEFYILEDGTAELRSNLYAFADFSRDDSSRLVIPSTVTHGGNTYPVTRMQSDVLNDFDDITSLTLPDSLIAITFPLEYFDNTLTEIIVSPDHPVFEVIDGVLFDKTKHELLLFPGGVEAASYTVPEGTLSIAANAFQGCDENLTTITLPNSLIHIGARALSGSGCVNKIVLSEDHPAFKLVDGVLFDKSGETLIFYPPARKGSSYTVPNGTKVIAGGAFYQAEKLTSVKLPKGITYIGDSAFRGCGFKSITLPESVAHIGDRAFEDCDYLTKLTIPDSVTHIGAGAFYSCWDLKSITLPKAITEIPDEMLCFCYNFESITIPKSVTRIGQYAFWECEKLEKVTLPDSLLTIGYGAFRDCTALKEITLPKGLTLVGSHAFDNCNSLKKVKVSSKDTQFGGNVFSNCISLKNLVLPEGMEIPEDAFHSVWSEE